MGLYLKGVFYSLVIDPMLSGAHRAVVKRVSETDRIVDVACGPGTLALVLARRANKVTAIDIEDRLIRYASERAGRKGVNNVSFRVLDASDLSCFTDNEFDVAVTSMAIHQFEPHLAVGVLSEMKRIAAKVIIADYNCPMPAGIYRSVAHGIERFAGGDHYRSFRNYMSVGGMEYFAKMAGLSMESSVIRGGGVLKVGVAL